VYEFAHAVDYTIAKDLIQQRVNVKKAGINVGNISWRVY
jgi:hypothetical protein